MESEECMCDARFSGVDEAEYAARGCPECICDLPKTCWECGRKFRGNHFVVRMHQGHETYFHKDCWKALENFQEATREYWERWEQED